jgi:CHAT domain-containing protein
MKTGQLISLVVISGMLSILAAAQHSTLAQSTDPLPQPLTGSKQEAGLLLRRGLYFADLYNWRASSSYFEKAQQLFEAAGDQRNALYAHCGGIRAGSVTTPITELSYQLAQDLGTNPILQSDKDVRMFCLIVKGDFDGEIDVPAMRRDWTEVISIAKELKNTKWQYRAAGQLGFADFYDGDLAGAQQAVGAALIEATNADDIGAQIFYLSAAANGLLSQQMNDQAIAYAQRAIDIAKQHPDAGYPLLAEQARLLAMVQAGRVEKAQIEFNDLLVHAKADNDRFQLADIYSTASLLSRTQNDISGAIGHLNEALRYAEAGYGSPTSKIQSNLSDLYRISGNLPKAEELARMAANSARAAGYIPLVPSALSSLAQVQISEGKYAEADETYDQAAMIQDAMIGNAESTLGKIALTKAASDLYAKHFALVANHTGDTKKAFAIIEQVRGRVMTDLLTSGASSPRASRETENRVANLRLQLMTARSDKDIRELRDKIFLAEQSRWVTPEISILKSDVHRSITLRQLQRILSPSEVLLEYVIDDPESYCLVVSSMNSHIVKLPGKHIVSPLVSAYLNEVKSKHPASAESHSLYDVLLGAIPEARNKRQLLIVRDGQLHLVPFDALLDRDNNYVLESRTVVYAPSASSFFLLRTTEPGKSAAQTVLAVGGVPYDRSNLNETAITRGYSGRGLSNLPSSREEAVAAAHVFPKTSRTLLLDENATETAFKQAADRQVIHLAVHAIANESHPERAALILLSDAANGEDGFLQASEIVQLRIRAKLVVLSACDTAVGPLEGQEGISTLSQAFLLAGARTVVSTLWSVEDQSTLYLMKAFYAELNRHKRIPDALAAAKRSILKSYGSKAVPYYWAGFTVEGVAEPPQNN